MSTFMDFGCVGGNHECTGGAMIRMRGYDVHTEGYSVHWGMLCVS